MAYEEIITRYRKQSLINKDCLAEIVRLRNQERSVYYLNLGHKLTLQAQQEWFAGYLTRNNDLYWCIYDKNGTAIGTNRLYDVSEVCCTQGSFIIDENYSMGMPYALESMLVSLEFAFDCLGVKKIINEDEMNIDRVSVGLRVKVQNVATKDEMEFTIVGSTEADPFEGKISNESEVGKSLLGKQKGETVEILVPDGTLEYKIIDITK